MVSTTFTDKMNIEELEQFWAEEERLLNEIADQEEAAMRNMTEEQFYSQFVLPFQGSEEDIDETWYDDAGVI